MPKAHSLNLVERHLPQRLAIAIAAIVVLMAALYGGAVPGAEANGIQNFCSVNGGGVPLAPWGQSTDNCAANDKHWNYLIAVYAEEHSACASTTYTTSKADLAEAWTCTGGPLVFVNKYVEPYKWTNGIERNNTTGDSNHARGIQYWCSTYNCK